MVRRYLSRRAVLRGAGGIAIALPWLEAMGPERTARAAGSPAKRFLAVYTPGGTVLENWRPAGTETNFQLSPILEPLAPVRDKIIVFDGLDMPSAQGEQDQSGLIAWLTGAPQVMPSAYATGPSVDQVLSPRLSGSQKFRSLELAVRWGTGRAHGLVTPWDIANFADTPRFDPIAPRLDPALIWKDLVGDSGQTQTQAFEKSVLDSVAERYVRLSARLGAADRQRLQQHLDYVRQLEKSVGAACLPPEQVDTSDYDPASGLNSSDDGTLVDAETDAAIPKVGKLFMDLLVFAFACDLTSVATLMWGDTEAKFTLPWLGLEHNVHWYMNDGGYHPVECTKIFTWYSTQHAYLIGQLAKTSGSDGKSLLDDTLVFFGSHVQNPANHAKSDMPFLLAGNGGGLKTGRWFNARRASHNNLLVSICNLCGDTRSTFGDPAYCTGPLAGLA